MRRFSILTAAALLALAGCRADRIGTSGSSGDLLPSLGGPTLIQCPSATPSSASAVLGPAGGAIAIGNTRVVVPAGALLAPTALRLTIPDSRYVEIDVKAGDADHFVFQQPILVSIDYSRCNDPALDGTSLSVWYIDSQTKAPLEQMGGVDDKLTHTITFSTIHLSGYAVAD